MKHFSLKFKLSGGLFLKYLVSEMAVLGVVIPLNGVAQGAPCKLATEVGASTKVTKKNLLINRLTLGCKLLSDVDRNIQDTILKRLASDIALERTGYKQGLFPYLKSTVKFVPTIVVSRTWKDMNEDAELFQMSKDIVCFYGQNEKGETMYFRAVYTDNSHFTKDMNPKMYRANVELFGQEFADKLIEKIRSAKGTESWSIGLGGLRYEEVEFARNHSDDGMFFALVRDRYSFPVICFFLRQKSVLLS